MFYSIHDISKFTATNLRKSKFRFGLSEHCLFNCFRDCQLVALVLPFVVLVDFLERLDCPV